MSINYIFTQLFIFSIFIIVEKNVFMNSKFAFVSLFFFLRLIKFFYQRNHLLNYLVIIEVYIVLMYFRFFSLSNLVSSSLIRVFFFIVIIVCGARLGISLLVLITRRVSKELEIRYSTFNID